MNLFFLAPFLYSIQNILPKLLKVDNSQSPTEFLGKLPLFPSASGFFPEVVPQMPFPQKVRFRPTQ
ncbi:MAG: hypothetical protein DWQ02_07445 [Bacteroidetes bacterium]|nr:MAG: hypothetical protein DWQ02_07445 [Bacteroidota bacterium]